MLDSSKSSRSKPTKRSAELNDFETQLMQADFLPKKKKRNASNPQIPDDEDIQRTLLESMPEQGTSNSNFLMVSSISRMFILMALFSHRKKSHGLFKSFAVNFLSGNVKSLLFV